MQHSFSSQSFLKQQRLQNYDSKYKPTYQHDTTVPKQQLSNNYLRDNKQQLHKKYFTQYPLTNNDYYYYSNHTNNNNNNPIRQSPNKHNTSMNKQSNITRNESMTKLKKKIKQIKYALKIAEQHNQQLHHKLNNQKKTTHQQLVNYQKDLNKYKSLYEMLIDSYEKKVDQLNAVRRQLDVRERELKQAKKVIRTLQKSSRYMTSHNNYNEQQQQNDEERYNYNKNSNSKTIKQPCTPTKSNNKLSGPKSNNKLSAGSRKQLLQLSRLSPSPSIKQMLARQQVSLQHLTHQNKLLRDQLILKNRKISQYQIMISTYQSQHKLHKSSSKQWSQLTMKISQLQQQNQKLANDKAIYTTKISRLEIQLQSIKNKSITTEANLTKAETQTQHLNIHIEQLNKQILSNQQLINDYESGQRKGKWKHLYDQLTHKYNQLLKVCSLLINEQFHYQNQKQFEKEIHLISKEIQRRQMLKYNHT